MSVITIPTKDRPEELMRLVKGLYANFLQYGREYPIHIFDDSRGDSARSLSSFIELMVAALSLK